MPTTLAALRDRVEQILADSSNTILATDAVDEGIRQALDIYSKARPFLAITTLTLASDTREIDVSSITGLLNISRVWLPYDSSVTQFPAKWRSFEHWQDQDILYIDDEEGTPITDQVARVFYTKKQTLNGLDSETTTTFADDDETLIAKGSAGYAILARAREVTEVVVLDDQVPLSKQIMEWAKMQIATFESILGVGVQAAEGDTGPATVTVKRLTRESFYDEDYPPEPEPIAT